MDLNKKAEEFINIKALMQHLHTNRVITKMMNGELFVMNYLYEHQGQAYPKEISDYMQVSTARIAMILKSLEKNNKITREADFRDNRYVIVKLTPFGEDDIVIKRKDIVSFLSKVFEEMGEENVNEYLRLTKLIMEVEEKVDKE
jgi:DNA-binding MarR family transcriptional regulator